MGFLVIRSRTLHVRGREIPIEWIESSGVAAVLAELGDGRLLLVRQYRVTVDRVTLEIPAGHLEPGETARAAAERELAEETGFTAERWDELFTFLPAIGYSNERVTLFLARGLRPGPTRFDEGEEIAWTALGPDEAESLVWSGGIADAKSVIGILLYQRLRREGGLPGRGAAGSGES